ncbi:MAG: EFR1 family ferrodoxin [Pseudomonadota bacterium]
MRFKFFVVFISPNGSTRLVADVFLQQLAEAGQDFASLNLSDQSLIPDFIEEVADAENICLLIGSPVYRDMAVPPVMDFIQRLPKKKNAWAVPFVTWGHACSGVALWQMGKALLGQGFRIAGAAKVAAVHSMMRNLDHPIGEGHPDADDQKEVVRMIDLLISRFDTNTVRALDPDILDYQPPERSGECKSRMGKPWMIVPKKIDTYACTQCGLCEEECPVQAIELNPYPKFTDSCFDCFNCVQFCPENAIQPAKSLDEIRANIGKRVNAIQERPLTQAFV